MKTVNNVIAEQIEVAKDKYEEAVKNINILINYRDKITVKSEGLRGTDNAKARLLWFEADDLESPIRSAREKVQESYGALTALQDLAETVKKLK